MRARAEVFGEMKNAKHPLRGIWAGIIQRCENQNNPAYHRYGGAGISICRRWRESFNAFVMDIGERPTLGHSLDRFPNPSGNYEPGNVRWATQVQQCRNRVKSPILGDDTYPMKRHNVHLPDWMYDDLVMLEEDTGVEASEHIRRAIDEMLVKL
jgi:hypothetical protein